MVPRLLGKVLHPT